MTNRLLRKYINNKSSRLLFATVLLLFVLHTSPVYCGACVIGTCSQGDLTTVISGYEPCHETVQERGCCANKTEKKSKYNVSGTDNCPTCDCSLKRIIENPMKITLIPSELSPILVVFGILDNLETSSDCNTYTQCDLSKPQVRHSPIFVLNSTFLI